MKTKLFAKSLATALCLAGTLSLGLYQAGAQMEISASFSIQAPSDFYAPLSTMGAWVDMDNYGRCWRPTGVSADWRPYSNGYWEWTDSGWYWVSDEPWAWACYHYGSWTYDPSYGWLWIPATEWAPAWVTWRTGGDYIGWAPDGPSGYVAAPVTTAFIFVRAGRFQDHIRPDMIIANDARIIRDTREIRNFTREQRQIGGETRSVRINQGPGVDFVQRATGRKLSAVPVGQLRERTMRSVPERVRQQIGQPANRQNAAPRLQQPQRPNEQQPRNVPGNYRNYPGNNPETHRQYEPNNQEVPGRNAPPERTVPNTPPERGIPQSPPTERNAPPANSRETPYDQRHQQYEQRQPQPQQPREFGPPSQARPQTPMVPHDQPMVPHGQPMVPHGQAPHQQPSAPQGNPPANDRGRDRQDHPQGSD